MGLGSLLSIIVWVVWVVYLGMLVVQMVRARRIWWAVVTSVVLLYWIVWFGWKVDFGRLLCRTVMLALWMFVNDSATRCSCRERLVRCV
jgi:hypothetical protein